MTGKKPVLVGLTGSIGMGKSTVAKFFAEHDIPVWDADASVHELYQRGAAGFLAVEKVVPEAAQGPEIDRGVLSKAIAKDAKILDQIEAQIHPLVAQHREAFVATTDAPIVIFDIPLIFENNNQDNFDVIVVVDAGPELQRARVLERPGFTPEKLDMILAKQMPNDEKLAKADFVVDTSQTLEATRQRVSEVVKTIKERFEL